mmetsp:Transcript_39165/g.75209  ORF Transcript_39165/g.75209 Transcript_39165/m.75209 type:complete len:487 (-) Transcript_39165:408-1868(-)
MPGPAYLRISITRLLPTTKMEQKNIITDVGFRLKKHYKELLYAYEQQHFFKLNRSFIGSSKVQFSWMVKKPKITKVKQCNAEDSFTPGCSCPTCVAAARTRGKRIFKAPLQQRCPNRKCKKCMLSRYFRKGDIWGDSSIPHAIKPPQRAASAPPIPRELLRSPISTTSHHMSPPVAPGFMSGLTKFHTRPMDAAHAVQRNRLFPPRRPTAKEAFRSPSRAETIYLKYSPLTMATTKHIGTIPNQEGTPSQGSKDKKFHKEIPLKNWETSQVIEWLSETAPEFKEYGHLFQINGQMLINISRNPHILSLAMPQGSDTSKIEGIIKALVKDLCPEEEQNKSKSTKGPKSKRGRGRRRRGRPGRRGSASSQSKATATQLETEPTAQPSQPAQSHLQPPSHMYSYKNPTTPEVVSTLFPGLTPGQYKPSPSQPIVTNIMSEDDEDEDEDENDDEVESENDSAGSGGKEDSFPSPPPLFNEFDQSLLDNIY